MLKKEDSLRIVVLTHNQERHFYFCNRIIESTKSVVGVFVGAKHVKKSRLERIRVKILYEGILAVIKNRIVNFIFWKWGRKFESEKAKEEGKYFSGSISNFYKDHINLLCADVTDYGNSINDEHYVSKIQNLNPDVIVVMGTCLVSDRIINSAKYVVNLHTGISPYFRGGRTNMWPVIEERYGYFGVTVHMMSVGIDSGKIIFTDRVSVSSDDNYGAVNCKSIILGASLMLGAVSEISNCTLGSIQQWEKGSLYLNKHWSNYIAYKYYKNESAYFRKYTELQKSGELDEIQLIENGAPSKC